MIGSVLPEDDADCAAYMVSERYLRRRQTVPATLKMGASSTETKSIADSLKKVWKDYFSKKEQCKKEVKRVEKETGHESPLTLIKRMRFRQSSASEEDLLHFSISRDDVKAVSNILGHGNVEVNALMPPGISALHQACAIGNVQCIKMLLDYGADIELKTRQGLSSLQIAARYGNFEAAELLIQHGANMDDIKDGI